MALVSNHILQVMVKTSTGIVLKGQAYEDDVRRNSAVISVRLWLPNGEEFVRLVSRKDYSIVGNHGTCPICLKPVPSLSSAIQSCISCGLSVHTACLSASTRWMEFVSVRLCPVCVQIRCAKVFGARPSSGLRKAYGNLRIDWGYKLSSLEWDPYHRSNTQKTYCYCGGPGSFWYRMLQCAQCLQWFHEACVEVYARHNSSSTNTTVALSTDGRRIELLPWDFNWFFLCSRCNDGNEFLVRIQLMLLEIIHIALMNLCMSLPAGSFVHLDHHILPWFRRHWRQLRSQFFYEWRLVEKCVLKTLMQNPARFQCAGELEPKSSDATSKGQPLRPALDSDLLLWRVRCIQGGPLRPNVTFKGNIMPPLVYNVNTLVECIRTESTASHWLTVDTSSAPFPDEPCYWRARYPSPYHLALGSYRRSLHSVKTTFNTPIHFGSSQPPIEKVAAIQRTSSTVDDVTMKLPTSKTRLKWVSYNGRNRKLQPKYNTLMSPKDPATTFSNDDGAAPILTSSTNNPVVPIDVITSDNLISPSPQIPPLTQKNPMSSESAPSVVTLVNSFITPPTPSITSSIRSNSPAPTSASTPPLSTMIPIQTHDALNWLEEVPTESIDQAFYYPWEQELANEKQRSINQWLQGLDPIKTISKPQIRNSLVRKLVQKNVRAGYQSYTNAARAQTSVARICGRRRRMSFSSDNGVAFNNNNYNCSDELARKNGKRQRRSNSLDRSDILFGKGDSKVQTLIASNFR